MLYNDFDESLIINESFSSEELKTIFDDIKSNKCKFFNANIFNIYLFEIGSKCDLVTKNIILNIVLTYLNNHTINSRVLMFNILEFLSINTQINEKNQLELIDKIMINLMDKYELLIMAGHHNFVAKHVAIKLCELSKIDACDIVKIINLLKKYAKIIWKHQKKNAIVILTNISVKLFPTEDPNLILYCEALEGLLNVDNLKLKAGGEWSLNISSFLCKAFKDKNIQRSVVQLDTVISLVSAMLKTLGLLWLPSNNKACHYHCGVFLREFSVIFATISSQFLFSLENKDRIALRRNGECLEILLSYLSVINGDSDREFSSDEEMLLVFILSKVSKYEEAIAGIINDEIGVDNIDESFFIYMRALWVSNALLGRNIETFLQSLVTPLQCLIEKFSVLLKNDKKLKFESINNSDQIVVRGVSTDVLNMIEDVIRSEKENWINIPPFIDLLIIQFIDLFHDVLIVYIGNQYIDEVFILGLINIFNLLSCTVSISENIDFFEKVEKLTSIVLENKNKIKDDNCKLAVVKMLLAFYGHPMTQSSFDNSEMIELLAWANKKNEGNGELEESLTMELEQFFQKYAGLRTLFDKRIKNMK